MSTLAERLLAHARQRATARPAGEPAELARRRAEALELFASRGLPTPREEDWRHTPLRALEEIVFEASEPAPAAQLDAPLAGALRVVLIDGRAADFAAAAALPTGVRLEPLAAALARAPERVCARLGLLADVKTHGFSALNTALFADGVWLELAPGAVLEQPLELLFLHTGSRGTAYPRLVIELGAGSRASVIEHHLGAPSEGPGTLVNAVTEIALDADAQLEHVSLQRQGPRSAHLAHIAVQQQRGSRFGSHSLALGGAFARVEIETALAGEGAHASLRGLYLGRADQHVDHQTSIDHVAPHTTSNELYKGILDGQARGVFRGRIHVRPHAQKIDAQQQSRTLLLCDGPTIHSKPQLEIYADDVRCSHGATVGRLDAQALFYLRSRGLDERAARALLTQAFARELSATLPLAALSELLEAYIPAWLAEGAVPSAPWRAPRGEAERSRK